MTVVVQQLRTTSATALPASLKPGQLALNLANGWILMGDGSNGVSAAGVGLAAGANTIFGVAGVTVTATPPPAPMLPASSSRSVTAIPAIRVRLSSALPAGDSAVQHNPARNADRIGPALCRVPPFRCATGYRSRQVSNVAAADAAAKTCGVQAGGATCSPTTPCFAVNFH